jgi:hypothetical protein
MERRRWSVVIASLVVATAGLLPVPASGQAGPPGYVTISFGRMQWVATAGPTCSPIPGTVDLGVVRRAMDARGIAGSGVVIPTRTPETGFRCSGGYTTTPGWDLLSDWHEDGWRFTSGGAHLDVRTLNYEQTLAETCGWLPAFAAHGIDATGMFAYGDNSWTTAAQADPTSRCFAYGRTYQAWSPNVRSQMAAPWFLKTQSVNGGRCNDPALACYTRSTPSTRYQSPAQMAQAMSAAPDTWTVLQFYRFVDGASSGTSPSWDCTSSDWRKHWTSQTELYCYGDLLRVLDALQAAVAGGGVQVADHLTVAAAWGRTLSPPATGEPRSTQVGVACTATAPTTCTATVRDSDDGIPSAPAGVVTWSTDGAGSFEPSSCQLNGVRPVSSCQVTYAPSDEQVDALTATFVPTSGHAGATSAPFAYDPLLRPDTTPPTVTITNPKPGSIAAETGITIRADASDAGGIAHVRFYVWTSTQRCTDTTAPYTCWWRTPLRGRTVTLRAIARDTAGNEAVHSIVITTV